VIDNLADAIITRYIYIYIYIYILFQNIVYDRRRCTLKNCCMRCALCELNNNAKRGTSLRGTLGTIWYLRGNISTLHPAPCNVLIYRRPRREFFFPFSSHSFFPRARFSNRVTFACEKRDKIDIFCFIGKWSAWFCVCDEAVIYERHCISQTFAEIHARI